MTVSRFKALIILAIAPLLTLSAQSPSDRLPMNQIQVLGSHNSYKKSIDPVLFKLLMKLDPQGSAALEYSHAPLTEQLDLGMRKLEIDVVYDPKGGLYAKPLGLRMMKEAGAAAVPGYDPQGQMMKPGFKVIHVPDVDFRSHHYTFRDTLRELRMWSDAHPRHLPIAITMNAKD